MSGGEPQNGSTNAPLDLHNPDLALHMTLAAFFGITWFNVVELNLSVYMTFKRKRGLYFWSVFASIWGIAMHSLAFLLKLYGVVRLYQITCTMITIGWYAMVTGQSLVLYSRLHLVVHDPRIIRAVLIMIICNAIAMHIPTTVLTFGSSSSQWKLFNEGFRIMEKIQMTVFCIQETIISGIYIWATLRFLRPVFRRQVRSVMVQLLWINVAIIIMDIAMLTMEYLNQYFIEAVMKGAIYSVKLKLEFAVLNQLMQIASRSRAQSLAPGDSQKSSSRRRSSVGTNGRGFRGFLRRVIPRPIPDAVEEPNNYFISPSMLQSQTSGKPSRHNRKISTRFDDGVLSPPPPERGIAMTTEIRQEVSTTTPPLKDDSRETLSKASFHHNEHSRRESSFERMGEGLRSGRVTQSQLEMYGYPSPPPEETRTHGGIYHGGISAPAPVAQPWNGRSSPPGTTFQLGMTPQTMISSHRPSMSNLKDGDSRTSSEQRLNGD